MVAIATTGKNDSVLHDVRRFCFLSVSFESKKSKNIVVKTDVTHLFLTFFICSALFFYYFRFAFFIAGCNNLNKNLVSDWHFFIEKKNHIPNFFSAILF